MQSDDNGPFSKDNYNGKDIYFCVQNKFVHIVEESSDYFVSFMYCGIYSILITYEYDLEYWIDKINTIFEDLLMEKQRLDL